MDKVNGRTMKAPFYLVCNTNDQCVQLDISEAPYDDEISVTIPAEGGKLISSQNTDVIHIRNNSTSVIIGDGALSTDQDEIASVVIGAATAQKLIAGYYNTMIGTATGVFVYGGADNTHMYNSTLLGSKCFPKENNGSNEIIIGFETTGNGSDTVTIGNDNITDTHLKGNINTENIIKTDLSNTTAPSGSTVELSASEGHPGITINRGDDDGDIESGWEMRITSVGYIEFRDRINNSNSMSIRTEVVKMHVPFKPHGVTEVERDELTPYEGYMIWNETIKNPNIIMDHFG